jgi:serine protease Do
MNSLFRKNSKITSQRLRGVHFFVLNLCFLACLLFHFSISYAEVIKLQQDASLGTGFLISTDGYLVTAWHVVKDKPQVYVGPIVGNKWKKAKIIKLDEKSDLALLKIGPTGRQPLEIAEWIDVPIGLEVYSIGYPIPKILGLSRKMTQGLVNGDRTESGDVGFFQFSAETQKGNSGGPIFSPDGLVIGVVQKKLDALKIAERSKDLPENVNYALKSATLIKFLESAGVSISVKKINLSINMRPYELYRQKNEAVLAVIARGNSEKSLDLSRTEIVD